MPATVKHTCPDIDKIIASIRYVLKVCKDGSKDQPDAADYFDDIASEIDVERTLEELRRSNSSLREWGEEMEAEKDRYESECDDLREQLSDALNQTQMQ